MMNITILHTNDIHGRVEGLTRIATIIDQIRNNHPNTQVLYFDLGDSEEYTHRLSSLTKGSAMHRLLEAAGCRAVVVGNAMLSRLGPAAVEIETESVQYPHLLATIRLPDGSPIPGTKPWVMIDSGGIQLGLIGLSSNMDGYETFFGLQYLDPLTCARQAIAELRQRGAQFIIILSHLGLEADQELAESLRGEVDLILGGHSHSLLPQGQWVGGVLIAQAGQYAEHIGRVDLAWDDAQLSPKSASVIRVTDEIPPFQPMLDLINRIEAEIQQFLGQTICHLPQSMDFSTQQECLVGNLMADALRWSEKAEIGLVVPGPVFTDGFPAGPLTRERLWSQCPSPGNPGWSMMHGSYISQMVERGLDPEFAAERHPALRGVERGLIHLSGAVYRNGKILMDGQPLDPGRVYRVAAADFEFEPVWGYVDEAWEIQPTYDSSIIMRDVLEAYLNDNPKLNINSGRLG